MAEEAKAKKKKKKTYPNGYKKQPAHSRVIFDYTLLKARIISMFGTQNEFAEALGTNFKYVSCQLVNGKAFNSEELLKWVDKLEIKEEEIGTYFYTVKGVT